MNRNALLMMLLSLLLAFSNPTLAQAQPEEESNTQKTLLRTGGGCMGGAIVGSVIPIFGSLFGCAAGAAYAWFSRDQGEHAETEPVLVDNNPLDDE